MENSFELFTDPTDSILKLRLLGQDNFNPIWVDWSSLWSQLKKEKGQRNNLFYKALGLGKGRQVQTVCDATCGLGKDSLRMISYGLKVWAIERSPTVFALLQDGLTRALQDSSLGPLLRTRFELIQGSANNVLKEYQIFPDVIYLDPMYSVDAKRTALSGKEMRIFHQVVGEDDDALEQLQVALRYAKKRVVVKRSLRADPLLQPNFVYSGSSTRYDVYFVVPAKTVND